MFVRAKKKAENRWQVQIVESVLVNGETRQKIVRNIGTAYHERELADFKAIGESVIVQILHESARQPLLDFADPYDFFVPPKRVPATEQVNIKSLREEKRINQGFERVMKPLFDDMNLDLGDQESTDIAASLAMARAFKPSSKLQAQKTLVKHFDIDIPLHKLYQTVDKLADKENEIKKAIADKTFDIFNNKVDIMFFDVTTLSFESQSADDLRDFGYSKDCKFNEVQVVLALVTTTDGMPITYKLFPGNQYEGHTLIPIIKELREDFKISKVFLAADRGLFNKDNLNEMDRQGIEYVVAAKLKTMNKPTKKRVLDFNAYPSIVNDEFIWLKELELSGRRLIVSYSSKRAKKDKADRERLLERLLKKAKDGKINYKDLLSNRGNKKFIKTDGAAKADIDFNKVAEEAEWDGLYGIVSNSQLTPEEIMERYRKLWQIEEAFRVNKSTLEMRPIYHWTSKRIKGHICLCFITYALVKRIQYHLKQAETGLSINNFLEALGDVQASIVVNKFSGKKYKLPSKLTPQAKQLFAAFGLKLNLSIQPIA